MNEYREQSKDRVDISDVCIAHNVFEVTNCNPEQIPAERLKS